MKRFLLDVYEGIHFRKDKSTILVPEFFFTFFLYYCALMMLLNGLWVVFFGPYIPNKALIYLLFFITYFIIFRYLVYPHRNTGKIDENIDEEIIKKKIRTAKYTQVGGLICIIVAFLTIALLFEIFEPSKNGGVF